jgi:uncharacterized protein (DUF1800 family)
MRNGRQLSLDNSLSAAPEGTRLAGDQPRRRGRRGRAVGGQGPGRAQGLNENYARELLELHTLGVDGGYTQEDVVEVARAFTGWTIDLRSGEFVFRPFMHDADQKVMLGHEIEGGGKVSDGEKSSISWPSILLPRVSYRRSSFGAS